MTKQSDKASYTATAEAKLEQLQAQIEALQAKTKLAKADAKVKYQEQLDALRIKQTDLQAKLESIKGSADSAWEEMKVGIEAAWGELKIAFDKAKSELDDV